MANKKILVLFSGGIDSTYLIYRNLEKGNFVYFVHNEIINNKSQTEKEKEAVQKLLELFSSEYPGQIRDCGFSIEFGITTGFCQQIMWAVSTAIHLQKPCAEYDSIEYGLISGDCGLSYKDDIVKIFNASLIVNGQKRFKNLLKFPLIKYSKSEIVSLLPKRYLKLISCCEYDGEGKFCNSCNSCRSLSESLDFSGDLNCHHLFREDDDSVKAENAELIDQLTLFSSSKITAAKCCERCTNFDHEYGKNEGKCLKHKCFCHSTSVCDDFQSDAGELPDIAEEKYKEEEKGER